MAAEASSVVGFLYAFPTVPDTFRRHLQRTASDRVISRQFVGVNQEGLGTVGKA